MTQHVPFELVDDVLEETKDRSSPSSHAALAGRDLLRPGPGLFPSLGYRRVWDKLVAGLSGIDHCLPSEAALRQLRRRRCRWPADDA
ncbi:transposase domain-containing protein [Streptomyces agglomeratus]|uniref:transposase domain-containing protein n=1 Tax=Streptomyces agglomeratus TaxID=285458 RepID=UPI00099FCEE0